MVKKKKMVNPNLQLCIKNKNMKVVVNEVILLCGKWLHMTKGNYKFKAKHNSISGTYLHQMLLNSIDFISVLEIITVDPMLWLNYFHMLTLSLLRIELAF